MTMVWGRERPVGSLLLVFAFCDSSTLRGRLFRDNGAAVIFKLLLDSALLVHFDSPLSQLSETFQTLC